MYFLKSCLTPYYLAESIDDLSTVRPLVKCNSCVELKITNPDNNTSITRKRCPVFKIWDDSEFSNGLYGYTFEDFVILNDEDGYCLREDGRLSRKVFVDANFDPSNPPNYADPNYTPTYIESCKKEDRRAPFADCTECDEGLRNA